MDKTLMLVKPDAIERGYLGKIISRIEDKGLKIVALKFVQLTKAKAEELYAPHQGKPFFAGLVQYMTSGPIAAIAIEGPDIISQVRKLMGATNCAQAEPGTIRGDYGNSIQNNLVHGSDSLDSANRELAVFFLDSELLRYTRAHDKWLLPSEAKV